MAEPERSFEYKGHFVEIGTTEIGKKWRWWYTIDSGQLVEPPEFGLGTEPQALLEAWHHSRSRIDKMK